MAVTGSRIEMKKDVGILLGLKASKCFIDGPAISNIRGRVATTHAVNDCLMEALETFFV